MIAPTRWLAAAGAALTLSACGGSEPPPKSPTQHDTDDSGGQTQSTLDVSAEIGALDLDKVTSVFEKSLPELKACLDAGARRVEFIGGSIGFSLKVGQGGHLKSVYVEQSTLGDRTTEKCMLDVLRGKAWPAPVGGETGLAQKSIDFDPPNDVRPPAEWTGDRVQEALDEKASDIAACKSSASGSYQVTMYVSTEGKALGVGMAPPDDRGEAAVDCLVEVLKNASYPSPGSWPAKVSFSL